jgi:hypothetical protein
MSTFNIGCRAVCIRLCSERPLTRTLCAWGLERRLEKEKALGLKADESVWYWDCTYCNERATGLVKSEGRRIGFRGSQVWRPTMTIYLRFQRRAVRVAWHLCTSPL